MHILADDFFLYPVRRMSVCIAQIVPYSTTKKESMASPILGTRVRFTKTPKYDIY